MRRTGLAAMALLGATGAVAQESVLLAPIVVQSAARDVRALLDTPAAASVVERDALEQRQASTFEGLIGEAPGVSVEGGPRGIAQEPNIRGFQDEQIVLRFDGGRFNFNQAHRGRFFVDPEIVERIEIVRGGGSTLYGSGALGGVIAVETRDVRDLLAPGETFGARLSGGYATNGEIGQASATLYGRSGRLDALGFFGWRPMGGDLEDGSGTPIRNSAVDVVNGLVKLGFEPSEAHRIELGVSRYEDDGTVPPNANAASDPATDVDRDAAVTTGRLAWDFAPPGSDLIDLSVLGYVNDLEITEDRNLDGRRDRTRYETLGFEAVNRSRFDPGRPVRLVYGIEAFRDEQEGERDGVARPQFPDAEATTVAGFAEATIALTDRVELVPGLRYDRYDRDPNASGLARVDESFWSPRLGISLRPNERWQVYGNVARAFRAPSLTELYNDGVHFAVPGFPLGPGTTFSGVNSFVPSPDLEPERSTQFELGARFEGADVVRPGDVLRASVNAYYADVDDFIDQRVTFIDFAAGVPGPGGLVVGGTTTSANVDARLWGAEAELDYDAGGWFAGLGLTIPRGEAVGGATLGSVPQDRLTATLGARPSPAWELGGRATYAAERDDLPEDAPPAERWTRVDLFASWRPLDGRDVVVRAGIDNLFDETYAIYPNALNQPGRTFKVGVSFVF